MTGATQDGKDEAKPLTPRQERLVQSIADFQMALSAVDFMCELDDEKPLTRIERRRSRCFEDAAVIAYGRAFTKARGLNDLSFKQLGLKPTADERVLHEQLMERRRKVVAHSDADRQRILFATERLDVGNKKIMMPHVDFDDSLGFYTNRWKLMEWLKRLIHSASSVIFEQVQRAEPIRYIRDHTQAS